MITDMASYLRFFDSVRRRTERDVAALPPEAAAWRPPVIHGEAGWDIGRIVRHICGSREYFASAYRGEGWIAQLVPEPDGGERESWVPLLRASAETYMAALRDTPDAWLRRKRDIERGVVPGPKIWITPTSSGWIWTRCPASPGTRCARWPT